jgi:hypothetical protein
MLAILSCALRSWCNRRRRSNLDEDAWRFLEVRGTSRLLSQ